MSDHCLAADVPLGEVRTQHTPALPSFLLSEDEPATLRPGSRASRTLCLAMRSPSSLWNRSSSSSLISCWRTNFLRRDKVTCTRAHSRSRKPRFEPRANGPQSHPALLLPCVGGKLILPVGPPQPQVWSAKLERDSKKCSLGGG
jgi:hypothetical protein